MKIYEFEVEMRVRQVMCLRAPDADAAQALAFALLQMAAEGNGELSGVLKWTDGRVGYRPMMVQTILLEPRPVIGVTREIAQHR